MYLSYPVWVYMNINPLTRSLKSFGNSTDKMRQPHTYGLVVLNADPSFPKWDGMSAVSSHSIRAVVGWLGHEFVGILRQWDSHLDIILSILPSFFAFYCFQFRAMVYYIARAEYLFLSVCMQSLSINIFFHLCRVPKSVLPRTLVLLISMMVYLFLMSWLAWCLSVMN